ncbi:MULTISPECIES: TauD/TfdA family dioxygenase [unclassified Micromonospora]|uniref:TauD/TfdA family dioxygenase n=1 Tax=unclassified Micromonospora TaxID=2617518 RepID=UPI003A8656C9
MKPVVIEPDAGTSIEACADQLLAVLAHAEGLTRAPRLFRGFDLRQSSDLSDLLKMINLLATPYVGGNSPRTQLGDNVYTSTEFSAVADITLHQELSYEWSLPDLCFFLCGTPSLTGGATPLCDAGAVLDHLDPHIVVEFEARGLRYLQRLPRHGGIGKSWSDTFEIDDQAECERLLTQRDLQFTWEDDDTLVLVRDRPATRRHRSSGRRLWFNQADQWHPSAIGSARARQALKAVYGDRLPHDVVFGDGTPIPDEYVKAISRTTRSISWAEPWQAGDLIVVDNQATMHGRDRYTGPRSVYVAMATLGS